MRGKVDGILQLLVHFVYDTHILVCDLSVVFLGERSDVYGMLVCFIECLVTVVAVVRRTGCSKPFSGLLNITLKDIVFQEYSVRFCFLLFYRTYG